MTNNDNLNSYNERNPVYKGFKNIRSGLKNRECPPYRTVTLSDREVNLPLNSYDQYGLTRANSFQFKIEEDFIKLFEEHHHVNLQNFKQKELKIAFTLIISFMELCRNVSQKDILYQDNHFYLLIKNISKTFRQYIKNDSTKIDQENIHKSFANKNSFHYPHKLRIQFYKDMENIISKDENLNFTHLFNISTLYTIGFPIYTDHNNIYKFKEETLKKIRTYNELFTIDLQVNGNGFEKIYSGNNKTNMTYEANANFFDYKQTHVDTFFSILLIHPTIIFFDKHSVPPSYHFTLSSIKSQINEPGYAIIRSRMKGYDLDYSLSQTITDFLYFHKNDLIKELNSNKKLTKDFKLTLNRYVTIFPLIKDALKNTFFSDPLFSHLEIRQYDKELAKNLLLIPHYERTAESPYENLNVSLSEFPITIKHSLTAATFFLPDLAENNRVLQEELYLLSKVSYEHAVRTILMNDDPLQPVGKNSLSKFTLFMDKTFNIYHERHLKALLEEQDNLKTSKVFTKKPKI